MAKTTVWETVTIVGVGLLGGSIGLALHSRKLAKQVIGVGRHQSSLKKALARHAIDVGTTNLEKGTRDADLIVREEVRKWDEVGKAAKIEQTE
mgnify:CR=1 FL=1